MQRPFEETEPTDIVTTNIVSVCLSDSFFPLLFVPGESVLRQWATEPTGIFLTFTIFIAASLIPIFGGKKVNKWGPFTAGAELINGRAAM